VRKGEGADKGREKDDGGLREGESLVDFYSRREREKAKARH